MRKKAIAVMHNISEQFYEYLSSTIITYLTKRKLEGGERFNLYLEQPDAVTHLYRTIKRIYPTQQSAFKYKHEKGKEVYETYMIHIEDSDLIVVASNESVKEDFITTLRNKVAEQADKFFNKNLLILFSGRLDSLLGGSESLTKAGMPLNGKVFGGQLESFINQSEALKKHEKQILKFLLEKLKEQNLTDSNSIFDYEGVVGAINQGEIKLDDYHKLGMFPHEELINYESPRDINNSIRENSRRFEEIEYVFKHGDSSSDLDNLLSDKGIKELNKADHDWRLTDFADIGKWIDEREKVEPAKFIGLPPYECNLPFITVLGRADGYSTTQKRRTNVIIFNPSDIYPIPISFKFNKRIVIDSIKTEKTDSALNISSFGNRINVEVLRSDNTNYRWLQYYDKTSGKNFSFKILVLKCDGSYFEGIKKKFTIDKREPHLIDLEQGTDPLIFNEGGQEEVKLTLNENETYALETNQQLTLEVSDDYETDKTPFSIQFEGEIIQFSILTEKPKLQPIKGLKVWKDKRERKKLYKLNVTKGKNGEEVMKLVNELEEYTVSGDFRQKLDWERQLIRSDSDSMSWEIGVDGILKDIKLENIPIELIFAYNKLREAYKINDYIPSLTPLTDDYLDLTRNYVLEYLKTVNSLKNNSAVTPKLNELVRLGIVYEIDNHKDIYLSPLHPLVLAYQLTLNEQVKDEKLYDAILTKLNPINLLPYLKWKEDAIYSPTEDSFAPEWIKYNNKKEFKKGISKEFVRKLVTHKITEFREHFSYLFTNSRSPIVINIFNLGDCKEVLQGLFDFYEITLKKVKQINQLPCIDVNIYGSEKWVTKFEELTFYNNAKELIDKDEELRFKFKTPTAYDADDLLNAFRRNVHFYTKQTSDISYAHISFFHFDQMKIGYSENIMSDVPTGMALGGLLSDLTSDYSNNSYRTGFSTQYLSGDKSLLEEVALASNTTSRVAFSNDLYEKDKALCSTIDFGIKESLEDIYEKSQWVTFIEPRVGLNFFKENEEVIIIHYSDQYNNTSGYDAITVTKKTEQYQYILEEFLRSKKIDFTEENSNTAHIINLFNAINGDWLLKIISKNDPRFKNEKLSLLSAVRAAFILYYHPEVIWIPTSLEEVLRVSGNAGLKQSEGFFSAKNLGKTGMHSDDLLLIGLNKSGEKLKMFLYPIEVKIGTVNSSIIKKAKEQGKKTAQLLKDVFDLNEDNDETKNAFKVELYKNFFAKLALVTAEKLLLYQVWEEQENQWNKVLRLYRKELLNNDFDIEDLNEFIGEFGVFLFGGGFRRKVEKEEDMMVFHFLESDGYQFLSKGIDYWHNQLVNHPSSIKQELLLINQYKNVSKVITETVEADRVEEDVTNQIVSPINLNIKHETPTQPGRPIQILFGHDVNSNQEVLWHPSTTSKVLHTNTGIIGTMGTGKTQFTKSIVTQLGRESKNNVDGKSIGILIFDYKGDYVGEDFTKATGAKVFDLFHLPYNPLAIDVYENALNLLPLHVASTIKETISKAYGLGKKQEQTLRSVIMDAYEEKGIQKANRETWTKPAPTISDVCELFMRDDKISQDSLYAALDSLHEFEIFEPDSSKTKSLFDLLDGVLVINLSGYDESVQNLVVAITLDLFYSQMQKAGHSKINGDFRQLNKMILVDEADNFLSKNFNSIRKILKEGREFGVGTILSTQFLSHFSTSDNDYSTYILTWIVHRVNEIKSKEVDSLFKLASRDETIELMNEVKSLDKHYSVVNLAGSKPIFIKDKAFWELYK